MADNGLCADLALLHKKMEFGFRIGWKLFRSFDEQPTRAQVFDAGNILSPLAVPKHPGIFGHGNARGHSSRWCISRSHARPPAFFPAQFKQSRDYTGRMSVVSTIGIAFHEKKILPGLSLQNSLRRYPTGAQGPAAKQRVWRSLRGMARWPRLYQEKVAPYFQECLYWRT